MTKFFNEAIFNDTILLNDAFFKMTHFFKWRNFLMMHTFLMFIQIWIHARVLSLSASIASMHDLFIRRFLQIFGGKFGATLIFA
jgi:hypothetical protein